MKIRPYRDSDWPALWAILKPVFRAGETYAYAPDISEHDARGVWLDAPTQTWVAVEDDAQILGSYYIKPNQPALGAHVCNCGYIVAEVARGRGVASNLCVQSQQIALELGFRAMQYNLVAASNEGAIHLWKKHGFAVVGTLPGAFHSKSMGYVDALVMYKTLKS